MTVKRNVFGEIIEDAPKPKSRQHTSDKFAKSAKQFLDEIRLKREDVKKNTLQIVSALADFKLPNPGEQFRIRTQTQLNLISLILKLVHEYKKIDELTISTYTLNKEAFEILLKFAQSGQIEKLNLLVASSYSFREPEYFEYLKSQCLLLSSKYKISLVVAWSHAKITLAKCGFNYFQMEGSLNYSTNNMCEQLLFCNDQEVYAFDYHFINSISRNAKNKALEIIC